LLRISVPDVQDADDPWGGNPPRLKNIFNTDIGRKKFLVTIAF
jgi:hypothetical protein